MLANLSLTFVLASALAGIAPAQSAHATHKGFDTPQAAAEALVKAAQSNDLAALKELFGPGGEELISSADPVQDKNHLAAFVSMAAAKTTVVADPQDKSRSILHVGAAGWPLPVPIVKRKGEWYFDAKSGSEEILHRRIGANELDAIQVCRGFVEAQWEYATDVHGSSGTRQFAQRVISSPGTRDGLYWRNEDGTPGGPISEGVAKAIEEGYALNVRSGFHGYYFKILKGQGRSAPRGELDYVIKGLMIGGFALLAVPVEYGATGVKTFMVSHNGVVYEKDLGPDSLSAAKGIELYDPDKTWRRTDDEWPTEGAK